MQKIPESPRVLNTKFYLFKRDINFATPEVIYYDDEGQSLNQSKFDPKLGLKLFVHGYMSNWNERGPIVGANAFLKLVRNTLIPVKQPFIFCNSSMIVI